ncbi:MAG: hypothetical protein Q8Q08_04275 [Candidatus Omnitrophota bacterium]|nr:hypothetical protein [Candidatus Omnitrophota bacterium]
MKIFKRALAVFFILTVIALAWFYVYIQMNGKQLVEENLSRVFNRPVTTKHVQGLFPLGIMLDELQVEGLLSAQSVRIHLGFPVISDKQLVIGSLHIEDVAVLVESGNGKFRLGRQTAPPESETATPKAASSPASARPAMIQGILIYYLEVDKGRVEFLEPFFSAEYQVGLKDFSLKAQSVSYPIKPIRTRFNFNALIESGNPGLAESRVEGSGWANFVKRNMDGKLQVSDPQGKTWLSVDLKSESNDMAVEGKIDLSQMAGVQAETSKGSIQDFVIGALQSSGLKVGLNFSFKTKMDDFHIEPVSLTGKIEYEEKPGIPRGEELKEIGKSVEEFGKQFYQERMTQPAANALPGAGLEGVNAEVVK